jgi:hypothetical protein
MKTQTLVIGYALAVALFLFGQRRSDNVQPGGFSGVIDLTHSWTNAKTDKTCCCASGLAGGARHGADCVSFDVDFE